MITSVRNTFTDKRHHGINPYILERKWGIEFKISQVNINGITQQNLQSEVLPLTQHDCTGFISQIETLG